MELFNASGAPALLAALREIQATARHHKDDEAKRLLATLTEKVETATATPPAEAEAQIAAEAEAAGLAGDDIDPAVMAGLQADVEAMMQAALAKEMGDTMVAEAPEADVQEAEVADAGTPEDEIPDPPLADEPEKDGATAFLNSLAVAHHADDFDRTDPAQRRQAFERLIELCSGLATHLPEDASAMQDRERMQVELEDGADAIMLLSCEGDDTALTDAADIAVQLIGDFYDRLQMEVSG